MAMKKISKILAFIVIAYLFFGVCQPNSEPEKGDDVIELTGNEEFE